MSKKITFLAKLSLGIILIIFLLRQIDLSILWQTLSSVKPAHLVLFLLLYPFSVWLSTTKWRLILKHYSLDLSMAKLYRLYWLGSFYNNFLPTDFGGDVYKFFKLSKLKKNKTQITSSLFLERLFGLVALLLVACLTGIWFISLTNNVWVIGIYLASWLGLLVLLNHSIVLKSVAQIYPNITKPLIDRLTISNKISQQSLVLSIVFVLQAILAHWLLFLAFGVNINLGLLSFLIPTIALTGLLPFTPNALGLREGFGVFLFQEFGVSSEVTLAVLLLARTLILLENIGGAFLIYCFRKTYS